MAELSIGGVMFPALLLWAIIAYVLSVSLRSLFRAIGLYRFVWHRALFDLAVTVILLGGTVGLATHLVGP